MLKKIHNNQIKAGNEIFNFIKNEKNKPVIASAQMQSGKTLSVVYALYKIIDHLGGSDRCDTLWLGPSDCNLKEQTLDAIRAIYINPDDGERYDFSKVENSLISKSIFHQPSIKTSSKEDKQNIISTILSGKEKGKSFIVVLDEGHIGIGENQTIPKFLEEHLSLPGIGEILDHCVFIVVTATPGPYLHYGLSSDIHKFNMVYVQPGHNYVGLKKLRNSGRLKSTFSVEDDSSKTKWTQEVFLPFISESPTYGITRIKGVTDELLSHIKSLKATYDFDVMVFNYRKKNIKALAVKLNTKPSKHTICIITDSYLQGSTLNVDFIGFWFDRYSASATEANTAQSAGRNCGYERGSLSYPIWTRTDHTDRIINFYDCAERSDWDGALDYNMSGPNFLESSEKAEIDILTFETKKELEEDEFVKSKKYSSAVRTVSKSKKNDMANDILRKNGRNMPLGYEGQIVYCDGPCQEFVSSYLDLKSLHPEYDGKILFIYKTGEIKRNFNNKTFMGQK